MKNIDYSLYLVTDRTVIGNKGLEECVEQALQGGVTLLQLREKHLPQESTISLGKRIKTLCDRYKVPLVINDRVEVAQAVGAWAVHLGQSDLNREMVDDIPLPFGISVTCVKEAIEAEMMGATYIGVGAMYETPTKMDASIVSYSTLKEIRAQVSLPIVTIGGMNDKTIPLCFKHHVDGVAVVSTILSSSHILQRTKELKTLIEKEKRSATNR